MSCLQIRKRSLCIILGLVLIAAVLPLKVLGDVKPIDDLEDKLEGITEEEKAVLEELFLVQQEIDGLVEEEITINQEIDSLELQMKDLEMQIRITQEDYDLQLDILQQVMVNYQRGGPASYIEILLKSKNLSEFLMSLNIMKDISHNVNELLVSLESSKEELEEEKLLLTDKTNQVEEKKKELLITLHTKQELLAKQEQYLASLQEDREFYQDQLMNITQMWSDCQMIFSDVVKELNRIIGSGYFTEEDLNLNYGFFTVQGYIQGETFNQILNENSDMTETVFTFLEDLVVITVPEKHLELRGYFEIEDESAIIYVVEEGTFYDMPLEPSATTELFRNGPLFIDFNGITGDITAEFKINEVWSKEGTLNFVVIPQF